MVLVGDTAHGMSPNMAQGGALAFEDALVLAGCLSDAATVTDAQRQLHALVSPPPRCSAAAVSFIGHQSGTLDA